MEQTLKKMEPRLTEPSGNQLNKLRLNGTGIHRTFLGLLSKLNSITAHRIFQNPLSQLRIQWNQSSHNVRKPTEQARNSTAPEHTEPSRTHQANFKLTKQNSPGSSGLQRLGQSAGFPPHPPCAALRSPVQKPSCLDSYGRADSRHRTPLRCCLSLKWGQGLHAPPRVPRAHPLASPGSR